MVRRHLIAAALALPLLGATGDLRLSLKTTGEAYLAQMSHIAAVAGRDTTYDYYERLLDDAQMLGEPDVPQGYTAAQWSQTIDRFAGLDLSLAAQLIHGSYGAMSSVRGLGEVLIRSSKDGTMQPAAVYVPQAYEAGTPAPLIVWLHGHPQSETELLAPPYIEELAERTHTIVVAPWGRGYYDFRGSASDVYDAFEAATRAFTIDPRKRFLAGYSMGGFSVFEVAPLHADDWSAVMCIAGGLLGHDASRVVALMRRTPFYVLTGSADESIPTQYPTATAIFLRNAGLNVSFYSQPGGIHRLVTLLPILTQAWNDMLAQILRPPASMGGTFTLPVAIPSNPMKT